MGGELLEGAVGEGLEMRLDAAGLEEELALEGLERGGRGEDVRVDEGGDGGGEEGG